MDGVVEPSGDWSLREYAVAYTRLARRCQELTEDLTRARAAMVELEKELIEAKKERRGRRRTA